MPVVEEESDEFVASTNSMLTETEMHHMHDQSNDDEQSCLLAVVDTEGSLQEDTQTAFQNEENQNFSNQTKIMMESTLLSLLDKQSTSSFIAEDTTSVLAEAEVDLQESVVSTLSEEELSNMQSNSKVFMENVLFKTVQNQMAFSAPELMQEQSSNSIDDYQNDISEFFVTQLQDHKDATGEQVFEESDIVLLESVAETGQKDPLQDTEYVEKENTLVIEVIKENSNLNQSVLETEDCAIALNQDPLPVVIEDDQIAASDDESILNNLIANTRESLTNKSLEIAAVIQQNPEDPIVDNKFEYNPYSTPDYNTGDVPGDKGFTPYQPMQPKKPKKRPPTSPQERQQLRQQQLQEQKNIRPEQELEEHYEQNRARWWDRKGIPSENTPSPDNGLISANDDVNTMLIAQDDDQINDNQFSYDPDDTDDSSRDTDHDFDPYKSLQKPENQGYDQYKSLEQPSYYDQNQDRPRENQEMPENHTVEQSQWWNPGGIPTENTPQEGGYLSFLNEDETFDVAVQKEHDPYESFQKSLPEQNYDHYEPLQKPLPEEKQNNLEDLQYPLSSPYQHDHVLCDEDCANEQQKYLDESKNQMRFALFTLINKQVSDEGKDDKENVSEQSDYIASEEEKGLFLEQSKNYVCEAIQGLLIEQIQDVHKKSLAEMDYDRTHFLEASNENASATTSFSLQDQML